MTAARPTNPVHALFVPEIKYTIHKTRPLQQLQCVNLNVLQQLYTLQQL